MKILVTGHAGFIGAAVARRLLDDGHQVVGIDNYNDYYDVRLKRARAARLQGPGFVEVVADLADRARVEALYAETAPEAVVHLAAQAGVRYSVSHPHAYLSANLTGFLHVLEGCRAHAVRHLVYASTSSVYGANPRLPYSEEQSTEHPLSLYAASKKANELMAHSYAHLYGLPCTGLRFFTVYGPWGRPDMALFKFARAILAGEPIELYNHGAHARSFTYIDDVVEGIVRLLDQPARPSAEREPLDPGQSPVAPYRIYNIGNETSVPLLRYVELLEQALGRRAERRLLPAQQGDVPETAARTARLHAAVGYAPRVSVEEGVARFVEWLQSNPWVLEKP